MKRNGNAEGIGVWGGVSPYLVGGVSPSLVGEGSGEGAVPPPQKIFVWQWYILVHSGRLF